MLAPPIARISRSIDSIRSTKAMELWLLEISIDQVRGYDRYIRARGGVLELIWSSVRLGIVLRVPAQLKGSIIERTKLSKKKKSLVERNIFLITHP